MGYSTVEYHKNFFAEIVVGNRDDREHMTLNHRQKCKQIININRILILFQIYGLKKRLRQFWTLTL